MLRRTEKQTTEPIFPIAYYHIAVLLSTCYKNLAHDRNLPDYVYNDVQSVLIVAHYLQKIHSYPVHEAIGASVQAARKKCKV